MTMLRLLICHDCKSVDELPAFHGRPEDDVLLDHLIAQHRFPDGNEHTGKLAECDADDWHDPRKRNAILEQIKAAMEKSTGLPSEWYASKNTYQDDAMACYKRHRRPTVEVGCNDYRGDDKRIQNPSRAGWEGGPRVYLCQFCPYESTVMMAKRHQRGAYK